jgi:hypothetical protein
MARRREDPHGVAADPPESDERAKDILDQQPERRAPGASISARVGGRRYDRARVVSCSPRIFERFDLADPWEPDSKDRPLSLGPVGMRFEERRQPAPHATVKQAQKKSDKPAWTPPKGIPDARGSKKHEEPQRRAPPPKPPSAPAPPPAPPRPAAPEPGQPTPLPPKAPPPLGVVSKPNTSGRFRMRPTTSTGPRVRPLNRVVETTDEPQKSSEPPRPEPAPSAPQSLDDLFGSMGGGRDKRVGRKKET